MNTDKDVRIIMVNEVIDRNKVSAFQWRVIAICSLIALLDGFDTQAIGFVAPVITSEFNIPSTEMGIVFSAGLIGLMFGAFALSPVADRIGRKPVIILSCVVMGVFSLFTATADGFNELVVYRFLTGIGLGGVMPNINTLTSEYAPGKRRAILMTIMFLGFPFGAAVGGFLSSGLIASYGWQAVFIVGGIAPLVLVIFLHFFLPESICFLAEKNPNDPSIGKLLNKIETSFSPKTNDHYRLAERTSGSSIGMLFQGGYFNATMMLWVIFFLNLMLMYTLLNWLPTLMGEEGLTLEDAILTTVAFNIGGVAGMLVLAQFIDRFGPFRVLGSVYFITTIVVAGLGLVGSSFPMAMGIAACAGFCITGSQFGINVFAVNLYPTHARSTGLGWALAVGRLGAIIGPFMLGVMKARDWSSDDIFYFLAIPALFCLILIFFMTKLERVKTQFKN